MADATTSWLRGALELAVAAVLTESERHGYAIAQRIEQHGLGRLRGGALYPVLGRMESAGLVAARWQAGEGGPGRKVYRLTAAGRSWLHENTARWREFTTAMDDLLTEAEEAQRDDGAPGEAGWADARARPRDAPEQPDQPDRKDPR